MDPARHADQRRDGDDDAQGLEKGDQPPMNAPESLAGPDTVFLYLVIGLRIALSV
jgi:hypothetical protein